MTLRAPPGDPPMIHEPWFARGEFLARLSRVQAALRADGRDALLAFLPETVTWLTGYFTRGYGTFQFAIIPASGEPVVVCRDVEAFYLDATCAFPGRVLWTDSDDRMAVAADAIRRHAGRGARLGVELDAWMLTAARHLALRERLADCVWEDASGLVAAMRLVKSPAEIGYQRRAARAAEAGMTAAAAAAVAGATEREVAAEVCAAMVRAGSDLPGPGVLSSGERAHHLHGGYSDRVLARGDVVQMECTPNVRHYHARFMRPMRVGEASEEDHRTVERLVAIQDAALAAVAPGVPARVPDAIYRDGVLSAGLRESYTNKTFYSVGLMLQPNGGEPLEAAPGCEWCFEPGQVFHTYVLARGFGMSETIAITERGHERLTLHPRRLLVT